MALKLDPKIIGSKAIARTTSGFIVAYCKAPMVHLRDEHGNEFWWRADLCDPETYRCVLCHKIWDSHQVFQEKRSTAVVLTCGDLTCGGRVWPVKGEGQ